jgi:hypothetical protein
MHPNLDPIGFDAMANGNGQTAFSLAAPRAAEPLVHEVRSSSCRVEDDEAR